MAGMRPRSFLESQPGSRCQGPREGESRIRELDPKQAQPKQVRQVLVRCLRPKRCRFLAPLPDKDRL